MSAMANSTPVITTVRNTDGREKTPRETDTAPQASIQEFCEKHYDDILPIIMEKARHDKRKGLQSRLDFGDTPKRAQRIRSDTLSSGDRNSPVRYCHEREKSKTDARRKDKDRSVFNRLSHHKISAFERLSNTYSPSTTKSGPSNTTPRDRSRGKNPSDSRDRTEIAPAIMTTTGVSKSLMAIPTPPKGLGTEIAPTIMTTTGTYDGTGDPEDHLKVFQAAAQVEHWAMPTWCHMFNSTLIGAARVWFDEFPAESINGYKDLKAAFLSYFMQQKKYVKDPVEIHNIKQKEGETIEEFMERFKTETGRMKGAPECMCKT
ncbi:reverse transcriptase domain-containing protein [Tanacetum coccineum]|uniref:Reverse transcriptase domain-containing protein n=1 Tax=Tanacetum coccineum TaxID=301880 RepID=A0ABQ5GZ11_9ASTR